MGDVRKKVSNFSVFCFIYLFTDVPLPNVVQDRQSIPLLSLVQPLHITVAILRELQQKFSFMASVGDMPDVPGNKMSFCSRHDFQTKTAFLPLKNPI